MESSNIDPKNPSQSKGLSEENAALKLQTDGKNRLTPPPSTPEILKFLKQFLAFFSILLEVGSLLCFGTFIVDMVQFFQGTKELALDNLILGAVLFGVVFLTSLLSYIQENKSEKVMEGFKKMVPSVTNVVRDGKTLVINAEDLVVGDVIKIRAGDKIPADIRIISQKGLLVDNSSLTGESELQTRSVEKTNTNPLESKNLCFFGTWAKDGNAIGVVIFTGDNTFIGTVAGLAQVASSHETPIHRELDRFIYVISVIAFIIGGVFLIVGFVKYPTNVVNNIVFTIGIIIANVPEGLLVTVTISLTLTATKMSKKKVLVKNLEAVETLGSTTTIASDKTGTLTQNRMTVSNVWYDDRNYKCGTSKVDKHLFDKDDKTFKELLRVLTLCNNAEFEDKAENRDKHVLDKTCTGDASETALIKFAQPFNDILEQRKKNPKLGEIPFNSKNKYQLSIHTIEGNSEEKLLLIKGAPERIWKLCNRIMLDGEVEDITPEWVENFNRSCEYLAKLGERVLGFAKLPLKVSDYEKDFNFDCEKMGLTKSIPQNLIFVGLTSMIDPPRIGVPEAIQSCKNAGIRVIMVTGDYPTTAKAIAKQIGIIEGDTAEDIADQTGIDVTQVPLDRVSAEVVTGTDIPNLKKKDWDRILSRKQIVFARTSPQQKLIIVEECQKRGEIVAVTGDGVNDSPALKKADIGVAMGIVGSDVAKNSADMILMDDNFASIVNGVEEGRIIFDNLKKSIAYTLTSNVSEIAPFLLHILFGIPQALSTEMILAVDLGADMVPAISLAYEIAESDIMLRPPRDQKTDNLVTRKLIGFSYFQIAVIPGIAGIYSFFTVMALNGFPPNSLMNMAAFKHFLPFKSEPVVNVRQELLNHKDQLGVLGAAQTAYFIAVIITRIAVLLICKTRNLSFFLQGMRNNVLNFGLFFELLVAVIVVYTPKADLVFKSRPVPLEYWLLSIPFFVFIMVYDELRKLFIRSDKGGWVDKMTYW